MIVIHTISLVFILFLYLKTTKEHQDKLNFPFLQENDLKSLLHKIVALFGFKIKGI